MSRDKVNRALVLALLSGLLAACASSPEAARAPGTGRGSGGDLDNWGQGIEIHGARDPYYNAHLEGVGRAEE